MSNGAIHGREFSTVLMRALSIRFYLSLILAENSEYKIFTFRIKTHVQNRLMLYYTSRSISDIRRTNCYRNP